MTGKKRDVLAAALFVAVTLVIFRPYFFSRQIPFPANLLVSSFEPWTSYPHPDYPHGAPNKPMGFDNLRIYYPLKTLVIDLVKRGQVPLWNPYAFAGNTLLGTYQSAIFHPLGWLFFVLPQIDAWSVIVILQPFLTAWFMYLFLRTLGLGWGGSIFGAFTFALSGFSIVWWEESYMSGYSMMALPLVLYAIERLGKKIDRWGFFLLVVSMVWSIVSGWFQMTIYVFLFTGLWTAYRIKTRNLPLRALPVIIAAAGIALAISGVHLIPSLEAYLYSARGTSDAKYLFDAYLLPLKNLVTLFAPDFFGNPGVYTYFETGFYYERMLYFGIIPFFLAVFVCLFGWRHRPARFWIVLFFVFLSLGFSLPTSWFLLYSLKLPFVSVLIPSRIFFLSTFCGSVLAAYGLEAWFGEKNRLAKLATTALLFLGLAGVWIWALVLKQQDPDGASQLVMVRSLLVPTAMVGVGVALLWMSVLTRVRRIVLALTVATSVAGSLYFAGKYIYFSDRRLAYPDTPVVKKLREVIGTNRFWSFGIGHIENNLATQFQLQSPEGYDSIFPRRYGELLAAASHKGELIKDIARADALISSTDRIDQVLSDPYRVRILAILGARYIVASNTAPKHVDEKMVPPRQLRPVWQDSAYTIFENQTALPRAFLVGDVEVIPEGQNILNRLFDPNFDPARSVVLESAIAGFIPTEGVVGDAEIVDYQPNSVVVDVSASNPAILFLSDSYYPGWRATVDNVPTAIYRANYSFRAVTVPPGVHEVAFDYQPDSWTFGLVTTGAGILALATAIIVLKKR